MASTAEFTPATVPSSGTSQPEPGRARASAFACVPWSALQHDVARWDALAAVASEPNPFFESWYLLPSLRALDPQGKVEMVRFEAEGQLAGLMPVARPSRYYRWPIPNLSSWLHDNAFLGAPLVARGHEHAFWEALLKWADRQPGLALFLHLAHLPLNCALADALREVTDRGGRPAGLVHLEERALLSSSLTPDSYLQGALSGKKRKELRRQFTRLSELGEVAIDRRTDATGIEDWAQAFLALEAAGWKGRAGSALACAAGTASLFREALAGAAAHGRLERLSLSLDGRPIAMLGTFLTPPGAFSFKTAFDENFARFSPGVLLQRENLAMLERGDIAWTDSCAAADHPMIDHIWRERRAIGRVSIAIGGSLRRALFRRLLALEHSRNPIGRDL